MASKFSFDLNQPPSTDDDHELPDRKVSFDLKQPPLADDDRELPNGEGEIPICLTSSPSGSLIIELSEDDHHEFIYSMIELDIDELREGNDELSSDSSKEEGKETATNEEMRETLNEHQISQGIY